MFPLGTVVFPHTAIPLRVFEPRYQMLVDAVLAGEDSLFGTVLIERGFEVGGGDQRFWMGTRVKVMGHTDLDEGHRAIVIAGIDRIRVERWLPDDPHPWAEVEDLPDDHQAVTAIMVERVRSALERVLVLASELGADTSGLDLEVSDDPVIASHQLAALSPVTPLDSYELLGAAGPRERLERTAQKLEDQIELLRARLGSG